MMFLSLKLESRKTAKDSSLMVCNGGNKTKAKIMYMKDLQNR